MLRAYRRDDSVLRLYYIADFLDFTDILSAHFAQEYFVRCVKLSTHHLYNTHSRVVAFGGHKHVVLCTEQLFKIELCTCFSVASCKSYYGKVGKTVYYTLCVIDIMTVYHKFDRFIYKVCKHCHNKR